MAYWKYELANLNYDRSLCWQLEILDWSNLEDGELYTDWYSVKNWIDVFISIILIFVFIRLFVCLCVWLIWYYILIIVLLITFQDQNESAEILKIKRSMQEEAKRFEKDTPTDPSHPDYGFMQ